MRRIVIIFVLLAGLSISAKAGQAGYDYTPVLIHLNKDKQHDTVGFNLVEHLPEVIYKRIQDGSVPLWGSPLKKVRISIERLAQLEEQSGTKFLDNDDIFINEYWRLFRRDFEFHVTGFTFFNRSEDGEQVNYGFVDAEDIKGALNSLIIPCNANGNRMLTYWEAIRSKRYHFNLVKFGKVDFVKKPERSIELKHQAFECEKIRNNALQLEDEKIVFSSILKSGQYSKNKNFAIYNGLEKYFNENLPEFLNLAPEGKFSHLDKNLKVNIEEIQIVEHWNRDRKTGQVSTNAIAMTIVANGVTLKTLKQTDISNLEFLIEFKSFKDYLKDKSYEYIITRVNTEEIMGYKAKEVQNALETGPWHLISFENKSE